MKWLTSTLLLIALSLGCGENADNTPISNAADGSTLQDAASEIDIDTIPDAEVMPDMMVVLPGPEANIDYRVGVESVTVLSATPGAPLTIVSPEGDDLLTGKRILPTFPKNTP